MKIGLLGGSFDPIHYGHIRPALAVKKQLKLDKIWLMPNATPPHKKSLKTAPIHRQVMVEGVCQQISEFEFCDIEINAKSSLYQNNHGAPNYTVNTLIELNRLYPQIDFTFIMGADSLLTLDTWHQWQQLFNLCNIAVCTRPNWQLNQRLLPKAILDRIVTKPFTINLDADAKTGRIFLLDVIPQNISSTSLRKEINQLANLDTASKHKTMNLLQTALPKETLNYILQHKLYQ